MEDTNQIYTVFPPQKVTDEQREKGITETSLSLWKSELSGCRFYKAEDGKSTPAGTDHISTDLHRPKNSTQGHTPTHTHTHTHTHQCLY